MRNLGSAPALIAVALGAALACGGPSRDDLFQGPTGPPASQGGRAASAGGAPWFGFGGEAATGAGGASWPPGGDGGAAPASGGAAPGAGGASAGGGGAGSPSGGGAGVGGTLAGGGTSGGTAATGGTGAGGSAVAWDGGLGPNGCDYSGLWASYVVQPVSWPATPLVLLAGEGQLRQWNLVEQHQEGLNVTARTSVCSIFLPDLSGDLFTAYAKFGIRFPDSLFDSGTIPQSEFVLRGHVSAAGDYTFDTEPFATVAGATLADPLHDPWPGGQALLAAGSSAPTRPADHDGDGNVGITVVPATGQGYSQPPTNLDLRLADLVFIAERTLSKLSGPLTGCDEVHGSVEIVSVGGTPGINSSVLGCRKTDGTRCTADDANFVDVNRPQFAPKGKGTISVVRMPEGSTCADVRARFPR